MKKLLAWLIIIGLIIGFNGFLLWIPTGTGEPWWAAIAMFYGIVGILAAVVGIIVLLNWALKTLTE